MFRTYKILENEEVQQIVTALMEENVDLSWLEKLLKEGKFSPNRSIEFLYGDYENRGYYEDGISYTNSYRITFTVYPLHIVQDAKAIALLLNFGANPNKNPSHDLTDKRIERVIIEAATQENYSKVSVLASFRPCIIPTRDINKALEIIILKLQDIDILSNDQLDAIKALINASQDLVELSYLAIKFKKDIILEKMLKANPALVNVWNNKSPKISDEIWKKKFVSICDRACKVENEINQYALIWIFLKKGHLQNNSILSIIPFELILIIMNQLCQSNELLPMGFFNLMTENYSAEQFRKMNAFGKIYTAMAAGDGRLLSSHTFWEENKALSPVRFRRTIRNKIQNEPVSLATSASTLTTTHYAKCNPENNKLINSIAYWYVAKDGIRNTVANSVAGFFSLFNSGDKKQEITINDEIKLHLTSHDTQINSSNNFYY